MHLIEIQTIFCASHQLRLPDGTLEPLHGHNWKVTVQIAAGALDALETVVDFHEAERIVAGLVGPWSNGHLNDVEPFRTTVNPSAERIAEVIGRGVDGELQKVAGHRARQVRVCECRVTEAPNCLAIWRA